MTDYQPTLYLKQMFHRPNMIPLIGIIFAIISLMIFFNIWTIWLEPLVPRGWVENDHFVPLHFPVVYVGYRGDVYFEGYPVEDFKKLSQLITKKIEDEKVPKNKIHLKVHYKAPFGAVQKVLKAALDADVIDASFITRRQATYADFWFPKNAKYRKLYL